MRTSVPEERAMRTEREVVRVLAVVMTLAVLGGCSSTSSSTTSGAGGAADMTASAKVVTSPSSLLDQLGGLAGVTKLAEVFGANLAANPAIAKFLDATAMTQVQNGLVNEVAKASNQTPPHAGADLLGALTGKGIDAEGVSAITNSLAAAAETQKLSAASKTSLMALLAPITTSLLAK